jgi:hypothetical protein
MRDNLADQIFARFIERSGFKSGWWWSVDKKPAATAEQPPESLMNEYDNNSGLAAATLKGGTHNAKWK